MYSSPTGYHDVWGRFIREDTMCGQRYQQDNQETPSTLVMVPTGRNAFLWLLS